MLFKRYVFYRIPWKSFGKKRIFYFNNCLQRYYTSDLHGIQDSVREHAYPFEDWVAALATLSELKRRGDLAPAEYERAKRKLLAP